MTEAPGDEDVLYILSAWFSPAYPVGAFSYSHGLEMAVEAGLVHDRASAEAFILDVLEHGIGGLDVPLLAHAYKAVAAGDDAHLKEVAELAAVFAATRELALESQAQGAAFLKVTRDCWPAPALEAFAKLWPGPYAYAAVVGVAAAAHNLPLTPVLTAYLHGFAANLVSAAVRLVPLGQTDGQKITAVLRARVADLAARRPLPPLEDCAGALPVLDWCSMKHEDQYTRLFRS